mmetsp:Transcript_88316/g.222312  ORF Transcript_88316/g.222312 Transcript_88316/m.222312 type:complete len:366 (+) Transcript_88316:235-1332(+)
MHRAAPACTKACSPAQAPVRRLLPSGAQEQCSRSTCVSSHFSRICLMTVKVSSSASVTVAVYSPRPPPHPSPRTRTNLPISGGANVWPISVRIAAVLLRAGGTSPDGAALAGGVAAGAADAAAAVATGAAGAAAADDIEPPKLLEPWRGAATTVLATGRLPVTRCRRVLAVGAAVAVVGTAATEVATEPGTSDGATPDPGGMIAAGPSMAMASSAAAVVEEGISATDAAAGMTEEEPEPAMGGAVTTVAVFASAAANMPTSFSSSCTSSSRKVGASDGITMVGAMLVGGARSKDCGLVLCCLASSSSPPSSPYEGASLYTKVGVRVACAISALTFPEPAPWANSGCPSLSGSGVCNDGCWADPPP